MDFIRPIFTLVLVFGLLGVFLGAIYWIASFVPKKWQEGVRFWVFALPATIAVFVGLLVPAIRTIVLSFKDDKGQSWVGFEHYASIFSNGSTRLIVINSLTWVVLGTFFTVGFGLTVARFADNVRGEKLYKTAVFLPGAISLVGAGVTWLFIYAGPPFDNGLLNAITRSIPGLPASWGGDGDRLWVLERGIGPFNPPDWGPGFNTVLLIVIFIWTQVGFATVIFSAAIKGVPDSLIEAARVDGATDRQIFYKVIVPYIQTTIITVATTVTFACLKTFDIVAVGSGGKFGTSILATEFYTVSFVQGRKGFGSALAVLILVMVIPIIILNRRAQKRAEEMIGG